jgi:hypothetical protein
MADRTFSERDAAVIPCSIARRQIQPDTGATSRHGELSTAPAIIREFHPRQSRVDFSWKAVAVKRRLHGFPVRGRGQRRSSSVPAVERRRPVFRAKAADVLALHRSKFAMERD